MKQITTQANERLRYTARTEERTNAANASRRSSLYRVVFKFPPHAHNNPYHRHRNEIIIIKNKNSNWYIC